MKIEPNMYVRTKDGDMFILDKIEDNHLIPRYAHIPYIITEEDVLKTSHNIIDLIEVGDYVNGSKVIKIEEYNNEKYIYVEETEFCNACDEDENVYYKEDTIKSIVTKEMFEQMKYEVKND